MKFDVNFSVDIIETMENYLLKERPPLELRDRLDIGYEIEGQSIILQEIRPDCDIPDVYHRYGYAKTTFVKSSKRWKVYWLRGNLQWYAYQPAVVDSLAEFLDLVDEDADHAFKG